MDAGLLIVDVQNDFCAGGSLAVKGGEEVARPLAELAHAVAAAGGAVFASRDWHPPQTSHFRQWGGKWPRHCVQRTTGAEFHPDLKLPPEAVTISEGTGSEEDGYSAFEGTDAAGVPFARRLRDAGVRRLFVGGLATDYCVRASVLEALDRGYEVSLLADAVRPVELEPGDGDRAITEMRAAGARLTTTDEAKADVAIAAHPGDSP